MNDQELRVLVREAIARHTRAGEVQDPELQASALIMPAETGCRQHASHGLYLNLVNLGDECLIEPTVRCNHCGYCKSHGH